MQRKELNFEGQNIYIGIDVHLKSWTVTILTETMPQSLLLLHPTTASLKILSAYPELNIFQMLIIILLMKLASVVFLHTITYRSVE